MPASADAGRAIYAMSKEKDVIGDEWLPEAVWIAAAQHQEGFLQAYASEVGLGEVMRVAVRGAKGERPTGVDWSGPAEDETGWTTVTVPKIWAETPLGEHIGTIWLRRAIELPAAAAGKPAQIRLGIVDDSDVTYINGVRINGMANMRNSPRQYSIPAGLLTAGKNTIAVRVSNVNGRGGIVPDPAPAPGAASAAAPTPGSTLSGVVIAGDGFNIPLAGDWRAKVEETWEGARRREILTTVPIAQQFVLANSPVADLLRAPAAAGAAVAAAGAVASPPTGPPTRNGMPVLAVAMAVVTGEMKFTQTTITARAGQHVELTFNNTDDMPHNVVVFKRGTMAQYEKELFGSMNEPNAQLRGFVPDSPNVLYATRLLNARESAVLSFDAPAEPGEYPFVCSFPGHWLTMRGVLRVE
jgi:azurin